MPDLEKVEAVAARVKNDRAIAIALGVAPETLSRRKTLHREFQEAIERGRAQQQMAVADRLLQEAMTGSFPHQAFYLERMCGWTRPSESEAPSESIRRGGLSSDLVAVLRQALLGELQQQEPEQPAIEAAARPVETPHEGITDIALRRAELLGTNGKVKE